MNRRNVLAVIGWLVFCISIHGSPHEIINVFNSVITVNRDASMTVTETISYRNNGVYGLHGIYRDFPVRYKDTWGNHIVVGFELLRVTRNGEPVAYHVETGSQSKRVYIGDAQHEVAPGFYEYSITYKTTRQLGFFDDHDELYWNVTGNAWRFPIERASVEIALPSEIPASSINLEGYTGYKGQRGTDYTITKNHATVLSAHTTDVLMPSEGFTIVASFAKGFVQQPTWWQQVWFLFLDNFVLIWLTVGLIILLIFYGIVCVRFSRDQKAITGTVIPRFYPPQGCEPSKAWYIMHIGFDTNAFAAEIVNMAVHGLLAIEHQKAGILWGSHNYTLIAKKEIVNYDSEQETIHTRLMHKLFGEKKTIPLNQGNGEQIRGALQLLKNHLGRWDKQYFNINRWALGWGVIIAMTFSLVAVFVIPGGIDTPLTFLYIAFFVLIIILSTFLLKGYTREGMAIKQELEGFRLFLATAESERFAIIGTPPTKTPEMYETYLPYAMALGVEEQWSEQFAPIFAQLELAGKAYVPMWYVGPYGFSPRGFSSFSREMNSVLNQSIATHSGASSGSGGRGSSGGGGGGGGGGSW